MRIFILFLLCYMQTKVSAQNLDLLERQQTVTVQSESVENAQKTAQDLALKTVVESLVPELIGQELFNKNKAMIHQRVTSQSVKFVPVVKVLNVQQKEKEYIVTTQFKISLKDLKLLLSKQNLISQEVNPVVLPLITFKINGQSIQWWSGETTQSEISKLFELMMQISFKKNGFYLIEAEKNQLGKMLPEVLQTSEIFQDQADLMNQFWQSSMLMKGTVDISDSNNKTQIDLNIEVTDASHRRVIADLVRKIKVDKSDMKQQFEQMSIDLANQLKDVWQKGTIGTQPLKLTLVTHLPLKNIEQLKEVFKSQVPQVRQVKEREISSAQVSYEIDTELSALGLSEKIPFIHIGDKKFQLKSVNDNELTYGVE